MKKNIEQKKCCRKKNTIMKKTKDNTLNTGNRWRRRISPEITREYYTENPTLEFDEVSVVNRCLFLYKGRL